MVVRTVGDLRELLRYSEDEEPLVLKLENTEIECVSASSSGGGRITILWFEKKKPTVKTCSHKYAILDIKDGFERCEYCGRLNDNP